MTPVDRPLRIGIVANEPSGDQLGAALIRDIHARNVQKDIHINEKSQLELLSQQFIHEWVVACDISESQARAELREALKESSVHLKPKKSPF